MPSKFHKQFTELISIIERNEYNKLSGSSIDVPENFNWVRDVFEPLIMQSHADLNMIELMMTCFSFLLLVPQECQRW